MLPFRHRKTAIWLLGAAFALTLIWRVWFTLPRLLGLAAERWLAIPGVESLRVEVAEVGASRLTLRELRGTYRGTGGDRLEFALDDVAIDFSSVTTPKDRVAVIATLPLTGNENWQQLACDELVLFENGSIIHRDRPAEPRYLSEEEGIAIARSVGVVA